MIVRSLFVLTLSLLFALPSEAQITPLPDEIVYPRAGEISPLSDDWRTVSVGVSFENPVVIAGPPSAEGPHPGVLELRNVQSDGFEARFNEWRYRRTQHDDTEHRNESASYLVIEEGPHSMVDGSQWRAGTFELDGTRDWKSVRFADALPGEPRLFLTPQTTKGGHPVAVRARSVSGDGFEVALFEEEALDDGHRTETVGYLAIYHDSERGTVNVGGMAASDEVDYRLFSTTLTDAWKKVGPASLQIEEEASADDETGHVEEDVDVLILGPDSRGFFFAQQVTNHGSDPAALRMAGPDKAAQARQAEDEDASGGWHLASEPNYTEVSGRDSEQTRRMDLVEEPLRGIRVGENNNRPCFVEITGIRGGSFLNLCETGPAGARKHRDAILSEGAAVRRLKACTNREDPFKAQKWSRVKGLEVEGNVIREDGSFDEREARGKYVLSNCRDIDQYVTGKDSEWNREVECGRQEVATGVIAHFDVRRGEKSDLQGLQLICRKVVREGG